MPAADSMYTVRGAQPSREPITMAMPSTQKQNSWRGKALVRSSMKPGMRCASMVAMENRVPVASRKSRYRKLRGSRGGNAVRKCGEPGGKCGERSRGREAAGKPGQLTDASPASGGSNGGYQSHGLCLNGAALGAGSAQRAAHVMRATQSSTVPKAFHSSCRAVFWALGRATTFLK
jgi:hypothetical protein